MRALLCISYCREEEKGRMGRGFKGHLFSLLQIREFWAGGQGHHISYCSVGGGNGFHFKYCSRGP